MAKSNGPIKPGQAAPASGQYLVVGPKGGSHGTLGYPGFSGLASGIRNHVAPACETGVDVQPEQV